MVGQKIKKYNNLEQMKNPTITYLLMFALITVASCFHNPGIVLQLPTNYTLPLIKLVRSTIKNVISKVVESFTEPLRKDFKTICVEVSSKEHCIYVNTTLVAKPTVYDNVQLIQINGAPYIDKNISGFLDPTQAMFKVNSTIMNLQVSREFVNSFINLYMKLQPLDKTIKTTQISSVADIDSQTLSVVFPAMDDFGDPRPVLLDIHVASVQLDLSDLSSIGFIANCSVKIQTQYHGILPYMQSTQGTVAVKLEPIINKNQIGARLKKVTIKDLQFNPKDIAEHRVDPPQLTKHLETLMTWTVEGSNGALNEKKQQLQFVGVQIQPKVSILKTSINVELKFLNVAKQIENIVTEQIL